MKLRKAISVQTVASVLLLLVVSVAVQRQANSADQYVSLSYDPQAIWAQYDKAWESYQRGDLVSALQGLTLSLDMYYRLRGSAIPVFPTAAEFHDQLQAAIQYARNELSYYGQQYVTLNQQLSECRGQRIDRGGSTERSASGSSPGRPPRPVLSRVPPPSR
jgi:hypothetical protein